MTSHDLYLRVAAKAELRVRMEDEAKNSKMNGLKILNQWRKIMRLAKAESLKKDVEILSQNHERDVDRKDAILQMLDRYLVIPLLSHKLINLHHCHHRALLVWSSIISLHVIVINVV